MNREKSPAHPRARGRVAARHEPLLRGLLADAHAGADLAPRRAGSPGLVHEVPDQVIGLLTELLGYGHGAGQVVEGVPVRALDLDERDEGVERNRAVNHASIVD